MSIDQSVMENMSDDELAELQKKMDEIKKKREKGDKYLLHKALEQIVEEYRLPIKYSALILSLEQLDQKDIIPSILNNEQILRFPTLITLASHLPCSDVDLRCGLVELFDSYVYHSDFGLIVNNLAPFDVDYTLKCCRSRDPSAARAPLDKLYMKLVGVLNSPSSEGEARVWIRKCMDDIRFMSKIIMNEEFPYRFTAAIQFMSHDNTVCELNDDKAHGRFVDTFVENGSDLLYAKRIASCFKLK